MRLSIYVGIGAFVVTLVSAACALDIAAQQPQAASLATLPATAPAETQEQAIAARRKLGGRFPSYDSLAGTPIVHLELEGISRQNHPPQNA